MKTIIFIISTVAMAYGITQLSYDLELSAGYMLAAIIGYYCLIVLSGNKKQFKDIEYYKCEIERLTKQLDVSNESANLWYKKACERSLKSLKWDTYYAKENERQRIKSAKYRAKKKAAKVVEPYTIEGKSIKQLVEENLGVEVSSYKGIGYICGYLADSITIGFNNNNGWPDPIKGTNKVFKKYKSYKSYWSLLGKDHNSAIESIKKHRNML